MEKLRICYLITSFEKGGAERFLCDLSEELLSRNDVEFIIGVLYHNDQYENMTKGLPIRQLNYKVFSLFGKNECKGYQKLLEEFRPHIIHTHRYLAEFLSSYYVTDQYKYVCHGHDNMVQLKRLSFNNIFSKTHILNYLEKRFLIKMKYKMVKTYFIANSRHTEEYYNNILPSSCKSEVRLIQYGFNYSKFNNKHRKSLRKGEKLKLINVGSFQAKKNQKFIVEIAEKLKSNKIEFEILLLGDGLLKKAVEQEVAEHNLSGCIKFHGNVQDVEKYMRDSHIYLHTAYYEPFGLVFLEAMASGLPCVTLDGKGNRDLIEQDKNGYLFFQQDASLFSKAIIELYKDSSKYEQMSEYCKLFASSYDIKLKTEELVEFYKSIV